MNPRALVLGLAAATLGFTLSPPALAQTAPAASGLATAAASAARAAAATPSSRSLTLDACLALALENGHRRRAAAADVDAATARQGQARSGRLPSLTAGLTGTFFDQNPNFVFPASAIAIPASAIAVPAMKLALPANSFGPGVPPYDLPLSVPGSTIDVPAQAFPIPPQKIELMDRALLAVTVKAMYPIYTGGLVGSRIAQAQAGVEAARQQQRQTDLDVAYDVKRAYWGVVLARQLLAVGRDTLARMEATLELTESVYKTGSGRVKKTDYLRNKSMVETIRTMVIELENQERIARSALQALVEWTASTPIDVADTALLSQGGDCRTESVLPQALGFSPRLAQVAAGLTAARAGVGAARSGRLPKVGLFADAHAFANSYDGGLMTSENKFGWSVGFGVDVPIFDGLRAANEVKEAKAAVDKLQHQDALLRQAVGHEVRTACSEIAKGAAQVAASRDAYQTATENRDLNVRAYQEELVETKDVIEAQLTEALLAAQHYKALYDHLEAQARLEMLAGRGVATR